jgi:hypothetical protein
MRREAVVEMAPDLFGKVSLKEELERIKELKNGDTS